MLYPYIDLHAHMQFEDFDEDRDSILKKMKEEHVLAINVGTTYETSKKGVALAVQYPDIFRATVGTHPVHATDIDVDISKKTIEEFLPMSEVVGIGECGLDFFRYKNEHADVDSADIQEKIFQEQIDMSKKYNKPLMLHVRESYTKTLEILSKNFSKDSSQYRGNAHFFVGTKAEAQAFLDLGFSVSFTGVITFVEAYRELVEFVPLERMFAETDSPYVSPVPFRGKKNNPTHVIEIYKKIAEIKNIPLETVKEVLFKNAQKYWKI